MLIEKKRILVIGQTPPPFGGQALMIQTLLEGEYKNAKLFHIRMGFSKDFNDMGSFKFYKFWSLFKTIILTWVYRFWYNTNILYYGPSGPNKVAMYRDMLLLVSIRFLFKKTIFHTHAGGSSGLYKNLKPIAKYFYRIAFFKPNILITLTEFSHGDDIVLKPQKVFIVPNGIKDEYVIYNAESREIKRNKFNLLYVGGMYKERGIVELIKAANILKQKKIEFNLNLIGIFILLEFEAEIIKLIKKYQLENYVFLLGTKINDEKWKIFNESDIFCFPTYVPSETFGLVLIESMQFKIPIIASRWNGIPFVVDDGKNGLLIDVKDPNDLANKIELLIYNENFRKELGENGRKKYLEKYSINTFINNMDNIFNEL